MNRKLLVFFYLIINLINCYSQVDNRIWNISEKEENDLVQEIRKEFNNINTNDSKYQIKTKDLDGYSTDGGELKAYYEQNDLKKIIVLYYGETGKVAIDYYFKNNNVFFIFRQDYRYNSPYYVTEPDTSIGLEAFDYNKTKIIENRFYISNNKLIRWLDSDKKKVDKKSKEFLNKQVELIEDIEFIKSKL